MTQPSERPKFLLRKSARETVEEFLYILSGKAELEADDQNYDLGPGDFAGFTAPSVGHHLKNIGDTDLIYLSGGERREFELADFPRHNKRMARIGAEVTIFSTDSSHTFQIPTKK
jgi:uncharacterized cupin superfamily protein